MEYERLGGTGLTVSRIALGCRIGAAAMTGPCWPRRAEGWPAN
jgi:aryl-alcohol dehydrogenase-like predicted oxidoreductase